MTAPGPYLVVAVLDVEPSAVPAFQRYEDQVLPLLDRHGGERQRRLRSPDGATEVHVLAFASAAGLRDYLADPDRLAARGLLGAQDLRVRVVESLADVC